jgi:threonine aldolase
VIDLRSDVFATPTEEMWAVMRSADVGWAYFGEDRSVNRLQALAADLLGKQAALFVPSCTTANLVALMTLAPRGSRVLVEARSHIATSEASGVAYVAGVALQPIEGPSGVPGVAALDAALGLAVGGSAARTSVVCLENTHNAAGGTILSPERTDALADLAHRHGARVHLDGARLFNAAVAFGKPAWRLTAAVDTVSISLNKGLGAPFGAILAGPRAAVEEAHVNRHRLGAASFHQAGILAAAAIVALTGGIDRLADDNRRALDLARRLAAMPGLRVDLASVQTNIVSVDVSGSGLDAERFVARLAERGVLAYPRPPSRARFVTHRLIGDEEIARAAVVVADAVGASSLTAPKQDASGAP